ncbi:hypothetical protein AB6A40_006161 [Gnathostoma spinigerum]|uniref:Gelsolin-like domain-containing protein n=1 Tax=Gnathostoma spinigerum TaxID=75299 RepID=A0ABD6EJR2_9BILA
MLLISNDGLCLQTEDVGRWNVHFWLGKDTSVDEQGSAAIKTVELDDALGGKPVQYREVQNHESSLFLSYFKQGIKYLAGGVKSGMRHVEVEDLDDFEPRMFQCRGKRNVRCSQVPCEASSLNLGDVFILDKGSSIYVWCPPESDRLERIRGMGQAASIRDSERGGKPTVEVLDQDWDSNEEFWSTLGGRVDPESIKPKDYTVDEDKVRECKEPPVLYRAFDDDDGELKIEEVSRGPFDKDDLRSEDAFILDVHAHGVFVWIGKHCSKQERIKAMQIGTDFVKREASQHRDGRSSTIPIVRVLETAEPPMFTQWSKNWPTEYTVERYHAQLFQCSYDQGKFTVEEISRFTQEVELTNCGF